MFDKKEYYKEYYNKNKEKYIAYVKKYQQSEKGKKKIKQYIKDYYQRPDVKQRQSDYDKRRYTIQNKLYRQINKQIRLCIKIFCRDGKLKIRDCTNQKYKILYGIDLYKIIDHMQPFPINFNDYELDHIKPIKEFNLEIKDDITKAYCPTNLQLISSIKNRIKSSN